jgi:type I restriction enzyme S subunit
VNSELGKIPEGWEVLQLGEVLESIESGSRPKGGIDPDERGIPSIGAENVLGLGRYDFGKEKYVTEDFYESMRKGKIKSGDVLLYKDGAKIGRKSMFRDGFPHEVCCINEHVFILRTNSKCSQNYLYFYLDRPDITEEIINLNANAAQPGINQARVKSLPILLPPKNLIRLFDDKIDPIIGLLFNLAKKNQILRKKRDLLLPKLISGELDVSELDIDTGDINEEK